jgi:hypothetical protein
MEKLMDTTYESVSSSGETEALVRLAERLPESEAAADGPTAAVMSPATDGGTDELGL